MQCLFRSVIAGMGGEDLAAVTKKEPIVSVTSHSVSSTCYKSLVHSSFQITSCVSSSGSLLSYFTSVNFRIHISLP